MEENEAPAEMVFLNYNPVDGTLTSTSPPVQIEFGSAEVARQINQQVQLQYANMQGVQSGQTQQIVITSQPTFDTAEDIDPLLMKNSKGKIRSNGRIPCPLCGKTYSCNANLRDHTRLHTGERPFQCSECGMTFAQRSNWRLHKRVHTGERPYMCGICGKTFPRSSHLPGHIRVHTGERPFQCPNCDHSFSSSQALKNHVRTHTGEKPFECEHCLTTFTHSSTLSSHKKICTGEKRKRGRPVGSGRRKRRVLIRARGRPKKARFGRPSKKVEASAGNSINGEITVGRLESVFSEEGEKVTDNNEVTIAVDGINSVPDRQELGDSSFCTETDNRDTLLCKITEPPSTEGLLCNVTSISPDEEFICNITQTKTEDKGICNLSENSSNEIFNESQDVDIKPPLLHSVDIKPDIYGLPDPRDLRQEAAVTMTNLHHSVINNLPTDGDQKTV